MTIMNKRSLTNWLFAISLLLLVFGSGYKLGEFNGNQTTTANNTALKNQNFDLYWQAYEKLSEKYIDKTKIDSQKMYYGSIKGMVDTIDDPYTFFLTPDENKQSKNDLGGLFEGIGAQLGLKNKRITVIAPIKDSPAEKAGIRAGDLINKVDGKSTKNWTLPQAVSKIRGKKGTTVVLTVERDGKETDISIMRDAIKVKSVELNFEKDYAYIKLNQFGENTNQEWDEAVAQVKIKWQNKTIKGLVLDLRDNPGGFLDSSVYLASEFVTEDKLIVTQESTTSEKKAYYASKKGELLDIPLVMLINKGSASASEILSGTLQQYKRAQVIGEKSFGKGSVQEALDLKDGAGLHVTVAKWILPNNVWINGTGITPDITVVNTVDKENTLTKEKDQQLEKAIQTLLLL